MKPSEASPEDTPSQEEVPTRIEPKQALGEGSALETVTLVETPGPSRDRSRDGVAGTSGVTSLRATATAAPAFAMHVEEVRRTRAFARVLAPFAALLLLLLPFLGGDPAAKAAIGVGLSIDVVAALWLLYAMRSDAGYTLRRALAFGIVSIFAGYAGIFYFGMFSPAVAIIPFGLYFFSVGQSFSGTVLIYAMCATIEAVLGVLVAMGVLADRGLVRADGVSVLTKLVVIMLVEITFFATMLVARAGRRAMVQAIDDHARAVRGVVQREELLREARQDLERALEAGGIGRFTDEVVGSYRLGQVIGRGGMGEVYDGTHVDTGAPAAVKLLHGHALGSADHVRRFLREAKIAASIESPHVAKVFEVGGLEAAVPFIAMEHLKGEDLAEILRRHRRLPTAKVVALAVDVAKGLEAAREAGVVHRDLKPRNLFLADEGSHKVWKILDFGVSRLIADQATLTGAQMLGTPSYMAPEQVASGRVDHRADVHALAVVCYRALTGRPAFSGDSMAEILYRVVNTMPPRPTANARVHPDVDDALAVGLAKDPEGRFDRATELVDALRAALTGELPAAVRARAARVIASRPWSE